MSFDQYFENTEQAMQGDGGQDDWSSIVEEALHAADLQIHRHRTQLEANLMKPLPVIPEDVGEEPQNARGGYGHARRPSSVYSLELDFSDWPSPHGNQVRLPSGACLENDKLRQANDFAIIRRPSDTYDDDLDSPDSPESCALNCWSTEVCSVQGNTMSSLKQKPFNRPSSGTHSAGSGWPSSMGGSSNLTRNSLASSLRSSADASMYSHKSYAKSFCMHERNASGGSEDSSRKGRFDDTAVVSFFDFSDDEEEPTGDKSGDSASTRSQSSKSKYLKAGRQLRKKALSLRIPTSKPSQSQTKAWSMPGREAPAFSAWMFRSSLLDPASSSPASECTGLEGQLMAGAAESAKAGRVLGLK